MPASDARIAANRRNAVLSTGPKTEAGKEKSRANSLKHGLTGAGVVMPEADAIEVERRAMAYAVELNASGSVGEALARRAALNSVRMERAADQQLVAMTRRIREVEAEFVAPEGVDPAQAAKLRSEAVRFAMFDPSKEATLARKYENAAERAFFRSLKELRQRDREARAARKAEFHQQVQERVGSILAESRSTPDEDAYFDAMYAELNIPRPSGAPRHPNRPGAEVPVSASRPG